MSDYHAAVFHEPEVTRFGHGDESYHAGREENMKAGDAVSEMIEGIG